MGKKFEVGKWYECANFHLNPVKVIGRKKKTVTVYDGKDTWNARARLDKDGDEFIQKTEVRLAIKGIETYSSAWEVEGIII